MSDIFDLLGGSTEDDIDVRPAPSLAHVHNLQVIPKWREIYITDAVGEDDGAWFVRCVRWFESQDSGLPIRLVLSTPGGDVAAMFMIHDAIRSTPCPVQIVAIGEVCSAGVLILACGDDRVVSESTALMSHESVGGEGELGFRASRDRQKFREWQHKYWTELMGRYTPQDAAWWQRKTERQAEYWLLGGQEIVDAGLADSVLKTWPSGILEGVSKKLY